MRGQPNYGMKSSSAMLVDAQVIEIRERYAKGDVSYAALADEYNVEAATIGYIVRGRSWPHIGGPRTLRGKGKKPIGWKPAVRRVGRNS